MIWPWGFKEDSSQRLIQYIWCGCFTLEIAFLFATYRQKTYQCRIYTETLSRVKDTNNVKGLENTCGNTWSSSPYLSEKSCGRARIMIIPLKVKTPLASITHPKCPSEKTTCKQFRGLERAVLDKTEWTKFSENKENQTIHLPPTEHSWQVANNTALFSRALTSVSVASVPCPLNRTWCGSHTMREFSRKCMMIHREVLGLS